MIVRYKSENMLKMTKSLDYFDSFKVFFHKCTIKHQQALMFSLQMHQTSTGSGEAEVTG